MSFFGHVTGNVGRDPELKFTPNGKAVCDLAVAATHRAKNRANDQWADVGEPLWLRCTFWDREAEVVVDSVRKGDKVTVSGALTLEAWTAQDGARRVDQRLTNARFLGVVPRQPRAGVQQAAGGPNGAGADPWATPAANAPQTGTQQAAIGYNQQAGQWANEPPF